MISSEENRVKGILEYFDLFGTKIGFYVERKPNSILLSEEYYQLYLF